MNEKFVHCTKISETRFYEYLFAKLSKSLFSSSAPPIIVQMHDNETEIYDLVSGIHNLSTEEVVPQCTEGSDDPVTDQGRRENLPHEDVFLIQDDGVRAMMDLEQEVIELTDDEEGAVGGVFAAPDEKKNVPSLPLSSDVLTAIQNIMSRVQTHRQRAENGTRHSHHQSLPSSNLMPFPVTYHSPTM